MLRKLFTLAVMAVLLSACSDKSGGDAAKNLMQLDTSTPQGAFMANIQAMKSNDIKSLMQTSLPPEEFERAKSEWAEKRVQFTEAEKARFAATMQMLTSEGAEEQIMTMIQPQLEQMQAMLPMMLMMANEEMISQQIDQAPIPANQKENAKAVLLAVVDWAKSADLASPEKARQAVAAAIKTARALEIQSLDELETMTFDEALQKVGQLMAGVKQALKVYDIDLDGMLDSIEVKDVKESGNTAELTVSFLFLGKPMEQKMQMIKKDGRWVSAPDIPDNSDMPQS